MLAIGKHELLHSITLNNAGSCVYGGGNLRRYSEEILTWILKYIGYIFCPFFFFQMYLKKKKAVFQVDLSSFLCKIILQSCFILQLFFRGSFIYFCASPYLLVTPLFLPIFLLLIALDLSWSSLSFSCPAKSSVLSVVLTFWI